MEKPANFQQLSDKGLIETLKKSEPVDPEARKHVPAIMKRKLIRYPLSQLKDFDLTEKKVQDAKRIQREYKSQLQAKEALEEIAEFEKRVFGKETKVPHIEIKPPNEIQQIILRGLEPPSPTQFFDIYKPPAVNQAAIRKERLIQSELASLPFSQRTTMPTTARYEPSDSHRNASSAMSMKSTSNNGKNKRARPAVWTLLDEPLLPAHPNITFKFEQPKVRPFVGTTNKKNVYGIPAIAPGWDQLNKVKNEEFESMIKAQYKNDDRMREKIIKDRVQKGLIQSRERRERILQKERDAGQVWLSELLTAKEIRDKRKIKPEKISEEDAEALEDLNRRENQLKEIRKEKKIFNGEQSSQSNYYCNATLS